MFKRKRPKSVSSTVRRAKHEPRTATNIALSAIRTQHATCSARAPGFDSKWLRGCALMLRGSVSVEKFDLQSHPPPPPPSKMARCVRFFVCATRGAFSADVQFFFVFFAPSELIVTEIFFS